MPLPPSYTQGGTGLCQLSGGAAGAAAPGGPTAWKSGGALDMMMKTFTCSGGALDTMVKTYTCCGGALDTIHTGRNRIVQGSIKWVE